MSWPRWAAAAVHSGDEIGFLCSSEGEGVRVVAAIAMRAHAPLMSVPIDAFPACRYESATPPAEAAPAIGSMATCAFGDNDRTNVETMCVE